MLPYFNVNVQDRIKFKHGVPHSMEFRNGFRVQIDPKRKIDGKMFDVDSVANISQNDAPLFDPIMTYGRLEKPQSKPFQPHFVVNDKIVLTFDGFFRQRVVEANNDVFDRIRYVKVMYFMEDDTISVMEPPVPNCGYPQGRIVRRSKIPKEQRNGEFYSWKDFNFGVVLNLFGIRYHLTDCDPFTKEFLKSRGIELNEVELPPPQSEREKPRPQTALRKPESLIATRARPRTATCGYDSCDVVLSFDCIRIEENKRLADCINYKLFYFMEDQTMAIKALKENQEGHDKFTMLLRRMKVPKQTKYLPNTLNFPSENLIEETSNDECITPQDLRVGNEIKIFGHRFLLTDCDHHSRNFFSNILKMAQNERLDIETVQTKGANYELPDYIGFGTPEDSLASCFGLIPRPPRKNVVKYLMNAGKFLRFRCVLDSGRFEDTLRRFILKYSLADGTISIVEEAQSNSGNQGGKFLSAQRVFRPNGNPKMPEYYTSKDLFIGAILFINSHRFCIVEADTASHRYIVEHPEYFSDAATTAAEEFLNARNECKGNSTR